MPSKIVSRISGFLLAALVAAPAVVKAQDCGGAAVLATIASQTGNLFDTKTTAPFVVSLSRTDASGTASVTADAAGRATFSTQATSAQSFLQASAQISDCFVVTGPAAGTPLSLEMRVNFSGDLGSGQSALVVAGQFGAGILVDSADSGVFNRTLTQNLSITVGRAFPLVIVPSVVSTGTARNTVSVLYDFGLPPGASIRSDGGFAPGGVPPVAGARLALSATSLSFTGLPGASIPPRTVSITNAGSGSLAWTAVASTINGGNWLSATPASGSAPGTLTVTAATAGLSPGIYLGQIVVSAPTATGSPTTIFVTLVISAPPPTLTLSSPGFFVSANTGAAPSRHALQVGSVSGTINWSATVSLLNGANWLTLAPASGTATAAAPSVTYAQVNYAALTTPGVYQAVITVTDTVSRFSKAIPFTVVLSGAQARIALSQAAFLFSAAASGAPPPSQTLRINNAGQGALNWTIPANPSAPQSWLTVSPASGTAGGEATLSVNPAGLASGIYQALAPVSAPGAVNDPELVTITLNVVPAAAPASASLNPSGLLFVVAQGASAPAAQRVTVSNSGGGSLTFQFTPSTVTGGSWLAASPSSGSTASGPATVQVSVNPTGLAAGVYRGKLTGTFSAGAPQEIEVALVVIPPAGAVGIAATEATQEAPAADAACTAQTLELIATTVGNGQALPVSFPKVLLALAVDNCGAALANATVVAGVEGTNIALQALGNGLYTGTWVPQRAAASIPIVFTALHPSFSAAARLSFTVSTTTAAGAAELPVLFQDGVVEGAGFTPRRPLAPGGIISLFGSRLGSAEAVATRLPLDRDLSGVSVRIGRNAAPLYYVSPGQINAQVPYEIISTESVAVVVSFGGRLTLPQTYLVAPVQPGLFRAGANAAILDGRSRLVTPENPARIADTLQIFATGLGITEPAVETGVGAPGSSRVLLPVTVTIGGQEAAVVYQGLAPGFVGLYQVNVVVPAGVAPGDAVSVVLRQNGVPSNPDQPITIPVRPQ